MKSIDTTPALANNDRTVPRNCDRIETLLGDVDVAFKNLRDKIEPALKPYDPRPTSDTEMAKDANPETSAIARVLDTYVDRLENLLAMIENADARVDI